MKMIENTILYTPPRFFEELIIQASSYKGKADIEFVHTDAAHSMSADIATVCEVLRRRPDSVCFACNDYMMLIYATAVEILKKEIPLMGASLRCFQITQNKVACRDLCAPSDDIHYKAVLASDEYLPDLGTNGIFKPLAGTGSYGVLKYHTGVLTENPFHQSRPSAYNFLGIDISLLDNDIIRDMTLQYEELHPYFDSESITVGIVEEYINPSSRKATVAMDGFVWEGHIYHFAISDNVWSYQNSLIMVL